MSSNSDALLNCLLHDLNLALPDHLKVRADGKNRQRAYPGIPGREYAILSLADSFLKKFEDEKAGDADALALSKFLACNESCKRSQAIDTSELTEIQAVALGEFKKYMYDFFFNPCPSTEIWKEGDPDQPDEEDDLSLREISLDGRFVAGIPVGILDDISDDIAMRMAPGPGASIGASGTSFYHKVAAGNLTCTDRSLYSLYKSETSRFHLWARTESIRFSHYGEALEVSGNKLTFVPKSREISRTICTEPSVNMLFQKGVGLRFEEQLVRKRGIDLRKQPFKNRDLAHIGSVCRTFGTIDLSSASDTISIGLLREVLPKEVFTLLMAYRSPNVTLPDGRDVELHMVSSMGNAFTFPLQTILFSSVVLGVYSALSLKVEYPFGDNLGNFAVFGDDIIVRREAYNLVVNILQRLGFVVNVDKSYNEGPFRESCGDDFLAGYNVRGVYCQTLKSKHDVYSLINRLNVWSANHGVLLATTMSLLLMRIGKKYNPVPPWEDDMAGVKVPWNMADLNGLSRDRHTASPRYYAYMAEPSSLSLLSLRDRLNMKRKTGKQRPEKKVRFNLPGVLLTAIGGYLREGKVTLRCDTPFFKKRIRIAPGWDYVDMLHSKFTSAGWQRWKNSFVRMNFYEDGSSGIEL